MPVPTKELVIIDYHLCNVSGQDSGWESFNFSPRIYRNEILIKLLV